MTAGRRPSLTERRATQLRLEVARTAMRMFAEAGDTTATVEQIAAEAGISARTFHRHFPAKEDVIRPLFRYSAELTVAALRTTQADADPIDAIADALLAQPREQGLVPSDVLFMTLVVETPEFRLRWLEADDDVCGAITDFLAGRVELGPDPRLRGLPAQLVSAAARYVTELWVRGDPADIAQLEELMRTALREALAGVLDTGARAALG